MTRRLALVALAMLAACEAQPHTEAWFAAHPEEMRRVLVACQEAERPRVECANAQAADNIVRAEKRLRLFREGPK